MKSRTRPGVILLGGAGSALSAARSLAGQAHVTVLGAHADAVRVSRSCDQFVDLGRGQGVQERWLNWLARRAAPSEVLLACNDDGLELVATHRAQLKEMGYRPGESRDEVVLAMLDKEETYALARRNNVPCPNSVSIRSEADIAAALETATFPCAVKPLHSHLFARHFTSKLFVAQDRRELFELLTLTQGLELEVMVTEIIPGPDNAFVSYYSYLDEQGIPLFHFTKRKIRGYPTHFGNWCYQVTGWDEEAAELGLRFFQSVRLHGVGNVEFKRDARDGRLKLIECNHRFTASNEILRRAGVDIPRLAYARAAGQDFAIDGFREGVHLWHPVEDLAALISYHKTGEVSGRQWFASLLHRQHFPVFNLADPLPSLLSWAGLPKRLRSWRSRRAPGVASSTSVSRREPSR